MAAFGVQQLPDPWLTCDALGESVDLVMPDGALGLAALGVAAPVAIEDVAERYLMRFKKNVALRRRGGAEGGAGPN